MITALSIMESITGYSAAQRGSAADQPMRIATIDPAYDPFAAYPAVPALPKVTFDGESTLSGKRYAYVAGYLPAPGDRVWMVPIGSTYLIAGAVENKAALGLYQRSGTATYRTVFGGGAHIEVVSGVPALSAAWPGALGIRAVPVSTASNGTASVGTTETRDAVISTYAFTSLGTTRRYRWVYSGVVLNGSVASDTFVLRVRDGGASTPTASSTQLGRDIPFSVAAVGTPGRQAPFATGTFTAAAGTRTLSPFLLRTAGTGVCTPVNDREFYVEDIGLA